VDTTGASDAFTATFSAYLIAGEEVAEAVAAGQLAASWAVSHHGGQESMPKLA
jgi:ribokinase